MDEVLYITPYDGKTLDRILDDRLRIFVLSLDKAGNVVEVTHRLSWQVKK